MNVHDTVHDTVQAAVTAEPVDGVLLLRRVTAREARRSRGRLLSAGAVLTAAAAVVAVAAVPFLLQDPPSPPVEQPAAVVPEGMRAVSWHGLQLLVPSTWQLDNEFCDGAQSDTVLVPGIRLSCLPPLVPGLTVVRFSETRDFSPRADRETTVSGRPARRGTTVPEDEPTSVLEVLEVPELDVTVTVKSPDAARARAILDTAEVVATDASGCTTRLPATTPPEPEVQGAADRVLPGEPDQVVLCQYGDLLLERAGRLTPAQVRDFQALVDAAPVGTSPSRVGISMSAELCPEYDRAPLVLLATYADGSTLQVFTRQNSCSGPDPDNGDRQVRLRQDDIAGLYQALDESRRAPGG